MAKSLGGSLTASRKLIYTYHRHLLSLAIYLRIMKAFAFAHINIYAQIFRTLLVVFISHWKQSKCPSKGKWIDLLSDSNE